MAPVAPLVQMPTLTKTGQKYQTLLSDGVFRIGLPNVTIVSDLCLLGSIHRCSDSDIASGKKLKRRLEDLEKRAASASESPERSNGKTDVPKAAHSVKPRSKNSRTPKSNSDATSRTTGERTTSYDGYATQDDRGTMFSHQCTRQLSASPPPVYSYPSYSQLDPYGQSPYGQPHSYHSIPSAYSDISFHGEYGTSLPSILPVTMTTTGPVKRPHVYADEDIVSPFSMSYASMAGIDLCSSSQHLSESNIPVHTPPRLLSRSARNPIISKTNSLPSDAAVVARLQR
jgi:hypothetical protein